MSAISEEFEALRKGVVEKIDYVEGLGKAHDASSKPMAYCSVFADAIRRYLPDSVDLANGEIIDSANAASSGECDLIAYDMGEEPYYRNERRTIVFVDKSAVKAVIEFESPGKALDGKEYARLTKKFDRLRRWGPCLFLITLLYQDEDAWRQLSVPRLQALGPNLTAYNLRVKGELLRLITDLRMH
jgi:hypothetical protein